MYECPNCAGNLKFDIASQMLSCEYCDTKLDPYAVTKDRDAEESADAYNATIFTCPQCGGELISEDTTAATFCSFCGASTILDIRVSKERRPGYIIPFTKTRDDCKEAYMKMMRRAFFAPKEFKDEKNLERFRGIYMPYWIYSFETKGPITYTGKKSRQRGDYLITDYYKMTCDVDAEYSGISYDASASFSDNLSAAIAPFDKAQSKAFTPAFLSGFYADTHDVDSRVYREDARMLAADNSARELAKNSVNRKYHVEVDDSLRRAVGGVSTATELGMFPVWFLSYRNRDRVSYAVVNGQTGRIAADIPVDEKKYAIGSLVLAIPIFILLNLLFTLKPQWMLGLAIILALICAVISARQLSYIVARETGEQDKGLQAVNANNTSGKSFRPEKKKPSVKKPSGPNSVLGIVFITLMVTMVFSTFAVRLGSYALQVFSVLYVIIFPLVTIYMVSGRTRRKKKAVSLPWKERIPVLLKPFAAIVLAVLILIINPVEDIYYYVAAIITMGVIIWNFVDILKRYNQLATRKLPQFNRRGGDEVE